MSVVAIRRRQFRLAHLFLAFWVAAILCGLAPLGVYVLLCAGVPLVALGFLWRGLFSPARRRICAITEYRALLARAEREERRNLRIGVARLVTGSWVTAASAYLLVLIWVCRHWGFPADVSTWCVLGGALLWSILLCHPGVGRLRWLWLWLPVAAYFCFFAFAYHSFLCDIQGGRVGRGLVPLLPPFLTMTRSEDCAIRFASEGPNSRLVTRLLGAKNAEWVAIYPIYCARPTPESVNTSSMLFSRDLSIFLDFLPTDQSRRRVLTCLACPDNYLRVHQGLLIGYVQFKGLSIIRNPEEWWKEHEAFFVPERDAARAARMAWDWHKKIGRYDYHRNSGDSEYEVVDRDRRTDVLAILQEAAFYQESGKRGGDREFADAFCPYMREAEKDVGELVWPPP